MKFIQAVDDSKHAIQPVQRCGPVRVNGKVYASAEVEIQQTDDAITCRLRVPVYDTLDKCDTCTLDPVPVKKEVSGKMECHDCSVSRKRREKASRRADGICFTVSCVIFFVTVFAIAMSVVLYTYYNVPENTMCRDVPVNGTHFGGPVHVAPYPAIVNYVGIRIVRCPKQAPSWDALRCDGNCTQFPPNYTSPGHYCDDYPKSPCCSKWGELCRRSGWSAALF